MMSIELVSVLIAVSAVGFGLAGLMLASWRGVRQEMRDMRQEMRDMRQEMRDMCQDIRDVRNHMGRIDSHIGELRERIGQVEGLLQGLREFFARRTVTD